MTGGTSGGMEARSKQWDDKKMDGMVTLLVSYLVESVIIHVSCI